MSLSAQSKPDAICDEWLIHEKNSTVKIYPKNGSYYGEISWVDPDKAPDKEAREEKMGLLIIEHLEHEEGNRYANGSIYAVPMDKHFDCTAQLKGDELIIKISVGWFTKTLTWTRFDPGEAQES